MTILTDNQRLLRAGREYLPKDLFELLKSKLPQDPPQLGQIVAVPSICHQSLKVVALHYNKPIMFVENSASNIYQVDYEKDDYEIIIPD